MIFFQKKLFFAPAHVFAPTFWGSSWWPGPLGDVSEMELGHASLSYPKLKITLLGHCSTNFLYLRHPFEYKNVTENVERLRGSKQISKTDNKSIQHITRSHRV